MQALVRLAVAERLQQQTEQMRSQMNEYENRLHKAETEFGAVDSRSAGVPKWEALSLPARKSIEAAKRSRDLTQTLIGACEAAAQVDSDDSNASALLQKLVVAHAETKDRVQDAVATVDALLVQHLAEVSEALRAGTAALAHLDACLESTKHVYNRLDLTSIPQTNVVYAQSEALTARLSSALDPSAPISPEAISAVQRAGSSLALCDEARRAVDPSLGKDSAELLHYERTVEAASAAVYRADAVLSQVRPCICSTEYTSPHTLCS